VTAPQAEDTKLKTEELKTLLPPVEKAEKKPKS